MPEDHSTSAERLPVLATAARVLFFRARREELLQLDRRHLGLGLLATWLVGMGRYWDSPRASLAQKLGVGSVLYVFVLSRKPTTTSRSTLFLA